MFATTRLANRHKHVAASPRRTRARHAREPRLEPMEDRKLLSGVDPSLDPTFNSTGYLTPNVNPSTSWDNEAATAVAVQPDGNIVWGGVGAPGFVGDFTIYRTTPTGAKDASFGSGGSVTVNCGYGGGWSSQYLRQILIEPSGKILLVGRANGPSNIKVAAVVQLTKNGQLDTTFGKGGIVTFAAFGTKFPGATWINYGNTPSAAAIDNTGSIVVAGSSQYENVSTNKQSGDYYCNWVLRYTSSGVLDTSFNGTGTLIGPTDHLASAVIPFSNSVDGWTDMKLEPAASGHNAIDVVGYKTSTPMIEQIAPTGKIVKNLPQTVPSGLTGGGTFQPPEGNLYDGSVLHVELTGSGGSDTFILFRSKADGTLDTTFGDASTHLATMSMTVYLNQHVGNPAYPELLSGHTYKGLLGNAQVAFDPNTDAILLSGAVEVMDTPPGGTQKVLEYLPIMVRFDMTGGRDASAGVDASFGVDGVYTTSFFGPGGNRVQWFENLLVLPSNGAASSTMYVVGSVCPNVVPNYDRVMLLAKYTTDDPPGRSGHRVSAAEMAVVDVAPEMIDASVTGARLESEPAGIHKATTIPAGRLAHPAGPWSARLPLSGRSRPGLSLAQGDESLSRTAW